MSALVRSARTLALALALVTGGAAATHHAAEACGGYGARNITDADRAQWALAAFLGELSGRVSFGGARVTGGNRAEITIEMDTRRSGGGRAKARQTFLLEKRDQAWKVVDWTFPVAAPAKVAARR
jgi:hypothetical protein